MQRRQYIQAIGSMGFTGLLAGCSGGGTGSEPSEDEPTETVDIDTPTETPEENIEIISSYTSGYQGLEQGVKLLSTNVDAYGNESYSVVVATMNDFEGTMDDIANNFSEAAVAAKEIGKGEITSAARTGESIAEKLGDAGSSLGKSAEAAGNGNNEVANQYLQDSKDAMQVAQKKRQNLLKPSRIESKL